MSLVTRNGVSIHYEVRGEGPRLLMIPGLGLDLNALDPLVVHLERRFKCVGVDNRGAGRSDAPRGPYTIPELAADAAAVLEASCDGPAYILGHSMGGFTAIELALAFPRLVNGLLLVATAPSGDPSTLGQSDGVRAAFARRHGPPEEIARGNLAACLTPEFLRDRPDDFERFIAERLERGGAGHGLAGQRAAAEAFDAGARLGGIRAAAVVVHGDADRVVCPERGRELARLIPGAAFHLLPGVGHMPFWEAPATLAEIAASSFLRT
jgi:3-oxoadipate enol-lactonase